MRKVLLFVLFFFFCADLFADEKAKVVELEPIVITPWRTEEAFSDVSRNVTVITRDDIEASGAQRLPELIQDKSGVVVSDYYGNPKGTVIDIRGFGEASLSDVLVLVDGRRTNQIDLSGVDWGQIDLDAVERVEIVRGPSSVLYGDNAPGGVINIITKKGTSEKPSITASGILGSYKYHKEYASAGGVCRPPIKNFTGVNTDKRLYIDYFFSSSNQETSGYRANNDYWANDYFGSAVVRPVEAFELDLSSGYHRDHYGMPGALYWNGNPWVITPKGINQIGREGTVFPDDRGFTSDYFVTAEPKLNFFLAGNDIIVSVFNSLRERRSKGLNVPEPNAWLPRAEYETCHHITTYELRPKMETGILWHGIDNKLILGFDFFHAKDNVLSGDRINNQQDETDVHKETLGLYAHDNIKISEKFILNAGSRFEWADYRFKQERLIVNDESKDLGVAAFNFGGGYKYNKDSQFYADFSKSYRLPNTEEYYQNKFLNIWAWPPVVQGGLNPNITQQKALNYEVGIKDLTFSWLSLNFDLFLMDTENEIYYDPTEMQNVNYERKTRRRGIETEAGLNLLDGRLKPFVNWTLQQAYFVDGAYAKNLIPFVPKNKISGGITILPIDRLEWTTGLSYTGSRYKISDQRNLSPKLKDYITVDTKLGYTYKCANIWAAVKNIFDEKYFAYGVTNSTGTAETFYPAPERSFEAGLTLRY